MDLFQVQRSNARLDGALGHGVRLLWGLSGDRIGPGLAVAGDEETRREQQSIVAASLRSVAGRSRRVRAERRGSATT
jgi:hypothetical protein